MFFFLAAAFVLLGSSSNAFYATRRTWRFQFFYLDFTLGFAILALLVAFTLGNETDLGFADRLLVAGRLKEVEVIAGAVAADLGLMLLFAAGSVIGLTRALLLTFGAALLVTAGTELMSARPVFLAVGAGFCIGAVVAAWQSTTRHKLALVGIAGGLCTGLAMYLTSECIAGEFGMGPYAGIALYGGTALVATPVLSIYFMNLPVEGPRVSFIDYRLGSFRQHAIGIAGGLACASGLLAAFSAADVAGVDGGNRASEFLVTQLSPVLAIIFGLVFWKNAAGPSSRSKFLATGLLSVAILSLAIAQWL